MGASPAIRSDAASSVASTGAFEYVTLPSRAESQRSGDEAQRRALRRERAGPGDRATAVLEDEQEMTIDQRERALRERDDAS